MNRPAAFRQVDVTRAIKAAKAAGMPVSRCEIGPDGKIVLVSEVGAVLTADTVAPGRKAYERWKAEQEHGAAKQRRV